MRVPDSFSVDGTIVIVTGGTAGIGLGIVEAFDKAGASVLAVGRCPNGADESSRVASKARYLQAHLSEAASPAADYISGHKTIAVDGGITITGD